MKQWRFANEQDFQDWLKNRGQASGRPKPADRLVSVRNEALAIERPVIDVPSRPKRRMNKGETQYSQHLEALRLSGAIDRWQFESIKLRLGDSSWYWPDFYVRMPDGSLEIHEFKGFMRDDARAKLQSAAMLYPEYRFWIIKKLSAKAGGGFSRERVWQG